MANAQLIGATMGDAVMEKPSADDIVANLRFDVGFRVQPQDLMSSFIVTPLSVKIFAEMAPLRSNMPAAMPIAFKPIVVDISNYMARMQEKAGVNAEKSNGLSNWQLAIKITRLAFCFGTDPKGVAAQIFTESKFDRKRVSRTGAVGFTQMTGAAIDEVNDQLGNRGHAGGMSENIPYLRSAINCYMGGSPFKAMFEAGVIRPGSLVSNNARARANAKSWLLENVDRDLVYGQITLKVLLGYAHANGATGVSAYSKAFRKYNGEPRGRDVRYARDNLAVMQTI